MESKKTIAKVKVTIISLFAKVEEKIKAIRKSGGELISVSMWEEKGAHWKSSNFSFGLATNAEILYRNKAGKLETITIGD